MDVIAAPARCTSIRYSDHGSYHWLWNHAPCAWPGNVKLDFTSVPFNSLCPAECRMDPAIVAAHLRHIRERRAVAPLVVCDNGAGGRYIHDGNHRYRAIGNFFAGHDEFPVRVAVAVPNVGFRFVYRSFGTYGTYLLEPVAPLLSSTRRVRLNGRTLVLIAHPDDETACAGLLQRLPDPIIAYATNGAPADEYFWRRYGSREHYARVRRNEAKAAVAKIGISNVTFLNDHVMPLGVEFRDQQLYRALPAAIGALSDLVRHSQPDAVLVPAYEGGHPDHDSCSFLGALLGRRFGLPIWEIPLYYRAQTGELRCQQFLALNGTERAVLLSSTEREIRNSMIASYVSQADVPDFVSSAVETFRPQPQYDYSRPPHLGTVNYEFWQWEISAAEVCRAFENCAPELCNFQPAHLPQCPPAEHLSASIGDLGCVKK